MDLPLPFVIRESSHRIHNPLTARGLATLGEVIRLAPGQSVLDLACGSGELLCTWARDHRITGTGVDISTAFLASARERAAELGVTGSVAFVHGDAAGHVSADPVDVAACLGATWIGDGVAGTVELLRASLRPGGMLLVGEPYWTVEPPDEQVARACGVDAAGQFLTLPGLLGQFGDLGCDVVEMVLADRESWDRYMAAQWLNTRRWLDAHPGHELAAEMRAELTSAPAQYARYRREYLGWGVFALLDR